MDFLSEFEIFRTPTYRPIRLSESLDVRISDQLYLDVVVHDYCNAKCKFCVGRLIHDKAICNPEVFMSKIDFAVQFLGVKELLFLGGEPTTCRHTVPLIRYCANTWKGRLRKLCLTTNGLLLKDRDILMGIIEAGITHINLSLMNVDVDKQKAISGSKEGISVAELVLISMIAARHGVKVRVNNNVFTGNNDTVPDMIEFYNLVAPACNSMKFSPLLRTDRFSTIDTVTEFNRDHTLRPEQYDVLWHNFETVMQKYPIVRNKRTLGFVEYSMIVSPTPVILNYNQHNMLRQNFVDRKEVNSLKLLPTGDLSVSWNREEKDLFVDMAFMKLNLAMLGRIEGYNA